MNHLDEHRLLDLLREPATADEQHHLAHCSRCRQELESWGKILEAYRDLDSQELSQSELHNLRVLFRHLGPSPKRKNWIARLVAPKPSLAQATAARGALVPTLVEYRAKDLSVILHVSPSKEGERFELHGTIRSEREEALEGSVVVLFSDDGFGDVAEPDPFGEFHFQGVPGGSYRLRCALSNGDLTVEDVPIGEPGEGTDG